MWPLVIAMLVILVLAGLVVLYVAFPHRGEDVPAAPWLGDAMRKGVDAAPTLDNTAEDGAVEPQPEQDADAVFGEHTRPAGDGTPGGEPGTRANR